VLHISSGDIEHFRPKAGYRQHAKGPLVRPGYYWLAYAWSNLFFCCELCNRRHKKNFFPLVEPAQRAGSHHAAVKGERPLFIDPAAEDPARYIGFREQYAFPINNHPRAKATIRALQLNRQELAERRHQLLRYLKKMKELRDTLAGRIAQGQRPGRTPPRVLRVKLKEVEVLLCACVSDSAEYAAMARAALPDIRI
jgi:hypothetical protein